MIPASFSRENFMYISICPFVPNYEPENKSVTSLSMYLILITIATYINMYLKKRYINTKIKREVISYINNFEKIVEF